MSTAPFHQIVWIDHAVSYVYAFTRGGVTLLASIPAPDAGTGHVHHKAGTPGSGHNAVEPALLAQTAEALRGAREILITGPGQTRHALSTHLEDHVPALSKCVIAVEALDRCNDSELHAFARPLFLRTDRMGHSP